MRSRVKLYYLTDWKGVGPEEGFTVAAASIFTLARATAGGGGGGAGV